MPEAGGLACQAVNNYDANVPSTKPTVEIDHSSPVPLHEQVAAAIRRAIADGEAQPRERLPPARDLAAVLGVNANTVFRGFGRCATRACLNSGAAAECR